MQKLIDSSYPDFSGYGYQLLQPLGYSLSGGRVTYLATNTNTKQLVVIKQFQFAQINSSWSSYNLLQREIEVLQKLNHPGIPKYLTSFETPNGFCLVQEHKLATSLAGARNFSLKDILEIATSILKILVYLQQQVPPVIHRDIKPENILLDEQMNAYLVDFGFAGEGGCEVAASSVVKGTLGFMPPEQLFNRQLGMASDLYGLGVTLVCLLTGTKSTHVGRLIDDKFEINFRKLLPELDFEFVEWLKKMVAPNCQERFINAKIALSILQAITLSDSFISGKQTILENSKQSNTITKIGNKTAISTWENAKSVEVLFTLLETAVETKENKIQRGLRLFACWCAYKNWWLIVNFPAKNALIAADYYAWSALSLKEMIQVGELARRQLKYIELLPSYIFKLRWKESYRYATELAISCTQEEALDAAKDAARHLLNTTSRKNIEVVMLKKLRQLVKKPFVN